jgi:hypothetical protein
MLPDEQEKGHKWDPSEKKKDSGDAAYRKGDKTHDAERIDKRKEDKSQRDHDRKE